MADLLLTVHDIPLSLTNSGVPPNVYVKQYDKGARVIRCSLYQGKKAYILPADVLVSCSGTTPGGSSFLFDSEHHPLHVTDNRILITITEEMTEHAGQYPVDIILRDTEGRILRTFSFLMSVEPCAVSPGRMMKRTFSEALATISAGLTEVFITDDGYLAIRCDDDTFLPPGSVSDLAGIIHDELVEAGIGEEEKLVYETASRYGLSFSMDGIGRLIIHYGEE